MSADSSRSAVRRLKLRFHPDKAPPALRRLHEEAFKVINTECAAL